MDFDKVRWKLADDLTPEEADLIVANKDKLNDEEKAAFSELIEQATPLSDNPLEDAINDAVDNPENQDPAAKIIDPEKNPNHPNPEILNTQPTAPVVPENVVTKDTLDAYLAEKKKEWDAEGKSKTEQEKEAEKITFELFEKNEVPADWNAAVNKFAPAIIDAAEKRIIAKLEAQNQKFKEEQERVRKSQEEVFQRFEQEFATLAKSNLIPDPQTNPEEYKKVHKQIIDIGDAHGKSNITDAYKLWSIIPVEHGGGLNVQGGAPIADPKEAERKRIEAQKQAAGKIQSGRGAPAAGKKGGPPAWATIHNTRMEDLIEQRLQQP